MQIVDITVIYTEEEKEAFKEEYDSRNLLEDKEHELYNLEKEWNGHIRGNHTDIYSPIAFTLIAAFFWMMTIICIMGKGISFAFALVTASPAFALAATGVAIFFWVRFAKQCKAYKTKEEELDTKRRRVFEEYQKLKKDHAEKLKTVEAIVYRKTVEKREREDNVQSFSTLYNNSETKSES